MNYFTEQLLVSASRRSPPQQRSLGDAAYSGANAEKLLLCRWLGAVVEQ